MPLFTNFDLAGDGIVTSAGVNARRYRVGESTAFIDYSEDTTTESRVWLNLTQEAAKTQVDKNVQPLSINESFSWSMQEESRVVGSYSVQRNYTKIITRTIGSQAPNLVAPTFNPQGRDTYQIGNHLDNASLLTVFITFNNTQKDIKSYYRIRAALNNGNRATTERFQIYGWEEYSYQGAATQQVSQTLPSLYGINNNFAIFTGSNRDNNGYRTIYRVEAYQELFVENVGTFQSPVRDRVFYLDNDPW